MPTEEAKEMRTYGRFIITHGTFICIIPNMILGFPCALLNPYLHFQRQSNRQYNVKTLGLIIIHTMNVISY